MNVVLPLRKSKLIVSRSTFTEFVYHCIEKEYINLHLFPSRTGTKVPKYYGSSWFPESQKNEVM